MAANTVMVTARVKKNGGSFDPDKRLKNRALKSFQGFFCAQKFYFEDKKTEVLNHSIKLHVTKVGN